MTMPKTTKTTKLRATKRDLVKPPGTPVRVSATPETVPEARATPASCSTGEICFVCTTVILEASTEREGEPALLCEGRHKSWAHTRCVGISDVLYEDIQSCEMPWMCRECLKEAAIALQDVPLVQEEVQSLRKPIKSVVLQTMLMSKVLHNQLLLTINLFYASEFHHLCRGRMFKQ